jgi:hypothetical protein
MQHGEDDSLVIFPKEEHGVRESEQKGSADTFS